MTIEQELDRARREGVAREGNLPFLLRPAGKAKAGILLVHGFTGSPWEMRPFGEALCEAGFLCLGVRLPGHGTRPEDLAQRRCEEWLEAVERGYRLLAAEGLYVYGIGQSTGALLLLALPAACRPRGLVLLSPFLRLRHRLAPAAGLIRFFKRFQTRPRPLHLQPYYYDRRPVNGVYQLYRLVRRVRPELPQITSPVLVLSAEGDRTVRIDSAADLFGQLGSARKEHHIFGPEVPHVLTTDENPRWQKAFALTLDFLNTLERLRRKAGRVRREAP